MNEERERRSVIWIRRLWILELGKFQIPNPSSITERELRAIRAP
jgi:hypothetical protein